MRFNASACSRAQLRQFPQSLGPHDTAIVPHHIAGHHVALPIDDSRSLPGGFTELFEPMDKKRKSSTSRTICPSPPAEAPTPTVGNDEPLLGSPLSLTGLFAPF